MWIRSQDRKALLNVNQVLISPSVDGKLKRCSRVDCNECEFNPGANKGCKQRLIEWLKQLCRIFHRGHSFNAPLFLSCFRTN